MGERESKLDRNGDGASPIVIDEHDHRPLTRPFKFVVAGTAGVGKTSVTRRFVYGGESFHQINAADVDFLPKKYITNLYPDRTIQLNVWDLAMHRRSMKVIPAYFRNADGVILIYDLCNWDTFDALGDILDAIVESAPPQVPIILMGNKLDTAETGRMVFQEHQNELMIKHKLKHNIIGSVEVSVQESENGEIEGVFNTLIEQCMKHELNQ